MNQPKQKKGFTLLEIIIVIVIAAILMSLALPRFFRTVEYSRSAEAFMIMSSLRNSVERCYVANNGTYVGCTVASIDFDVPNGDPGTHFTYSITGQTATAYTLTATRNVFESGDGTSHIYFEQDPSGLTRSGDGAFSAVK
jgi:type IV pilus assembly protein PilE